ncbi:DUF3422 family protein [Ephemeroptericola cinctiostellae]|nr:DUF3422 domain-containing protein [Ephemeroptericola cinctiostellae]
MPIKPPMQSNLYHETHARPYLTVGTPSVVGHVLFWKGGTHSKTLWHIAQSLIAQYYPILTGTTAPFFEYECASHRLRFEQHTEFDTLTLTQPLRTIHGIDQVNPLDLLDPTQLQACSQDLLVKTLVYVVPDAISSIGIDSGTFEHPQLQAIMDPKYGAYVLEKRAAVFTDFDLDTKGFSRFVIANQSLNDSTVGRVVTRLLEIENYRIMALIPLEAARAVSRSLAGMDAHLAQLLNQLTQTSDEPVQRELLAQLLEIAKNIEHHRNQLSARFNASQAYYDLVQFSYGKLYEENFGTLQRLQTFIERRLGPAIRTCTSVKLRLEDISQRVDRIAELLQTEINLQIQVQNTAMLSGMHQSTRMQLKMQKTVESISIVALTYYALGVLGYLFAGIVPSEYKTMVMTILVIPVAGLIWHMQRKLIHQLHESDDKDTLS